MTSSTLTLEQVETLAEQLPPQDQLRLVARISEKLSSALPGPPPIDEEEELQRRQWEADELLARCDALAEQREGEFDVTEEIRKMRAVKTPATVVLPIRIDPKIVELLRKKYQPVPVSTAIRRLLARSVGVLPLARTHPPGRPKREQKSCQK